MVKPFKVTVLVTFWYQENMSDCIHDNNVFAACMYFIKIKQIFIEYWYLFLFQQTVYIYSISYGTVVMYATDMSAGSWIFLWVQGPTFAWTWLLRKKGNNYELIVLITDNFSSFRIVSHSYNFVQCLVICFPIIS